jgi:hypothetical protein
MLSEVDSFREGRTDLAMLVSNLKGLLGASDLHRIELVGAFWDHFTPIDWELELRNEGWAPRGASSDEQLDEALDSFREWVERILARPNEGRE